MLRGMYRERASLLPGAVLWTRTVPAPGGVCRIIPDGSQDLIWVDGALLVAGPDTGPYLTDCRPGARYVGLRFAPGTATAVLGVPAHELRDSRLPLDALWPAARVRRISEAADPAAALESAASAACASPPDPVAAAVAGRLRTGASVAGTAAAVGLSERQLHRRCLDAFGYGPRMLGRVLRMRRAVGLARRGMPFATVAATTGYADQAHLAREVKALTGVPLGALT